MIEIESIEDYEERMERKYENEKIRKYKIRANKLIRKILDSINFGLCYFDVHASINPSNKYQIDFYDSDNNLLCSADQSKKQFELWKDQNLYVRIPLKNGNIVRYRFYKELGGYTHIFKMKDDQKEKTIRFYIKNYRCTELDISAIIPERKIDGVNAFMSIRPHGYYVGVNSKENGVIRERSINYGEKNCKDQYSPTVSTYENIDFGSDTETNIFKHLYISPNDFSINYQDYEIISESFQKKLPFVITIHPRNIELTKKAIEVLNENYPSIKGLIENMTICKKIMNVEYINNPIIEEIENKVINEHCDFKKGKEKVKGN